MTKSMKTRKLELVRNTIYDNAMVLFARQGFNETTLEEIAEVSGVSLRTLFRYFPTKNDLFGYSLAAYCDTLTAAVGSAPSEIGASELMLHTALAGMKFAMMQPRLRQVMGVAERNFPARQAFATGLVEVEERLTDAFATRIVDSNAKRFQPRMLAFATQMAISLALTAWFAGEFEEYPAALESVLRQLSRLFSIENVTGAVERRVSDSQRTDKVRLASAAMGTA